MYITKINDVNGYGESVAEYWGRWASNTLFLGTGLGTLVTSIAPGEQGGIPTTIPSRVSTGLVDAVTRPATAFATSFGSGVGKGVGTLLVLVAIGGTIYYFVKKKS